MKYCNYCKLHVNGEREHCPLCKNRLTEPVKALDDRGEIFPYIQTYYERYGMFYRIMLFLSVVVMVISIMLNILLKVGVMWSLAVAAGIGCLWISILIAMFKRKNISKNLLWQMVFISVGAVAWDYFTGWRAWSVTYVLPIMYMAVMLALVLVNRALKVNIADYMIYTVLGGLSGIVPVLFILTEKVRSVLPSVLCVASSVIFLAAILIFQGERMKAEMKRRLHL